MTTKILSRQILGRLKLYGSYGGREIYLTQCKNVFAVSVFLKLLMELKN